MADDPAVVERGVLTAPAEAWDLAVRRDEVTGQRAVGLGGRGRTSSGASAASTARR